MYSLNIADTSSESELKLSSFGSLFLQLKLSRLFLKKLLPVKIRVNVKCHPLQGFCVQYKEFGKFDFRLIALITFQCYRLYTDIKPSDEILVFWMTRVVFPFRLCLKKKMEKCNITISD
jgi:hypothetical protein